jgi:hypothetical protein
LVDAGLLVSLPSCLQQLMEVVVPPQQQQQQQQQQQVRDQQQQQQQPTHPRELLHLLEMLLSSVWAVFIILHAAVRLLCGTDAAHFLGVPGLPAVAPLLQACSLIKEYMLQPAGTAPEAGAASGGSNSNSTGNSNSSSSSSSSGEGTATQGLTWMLFEVHLAAGSLLVTLCGRLDAPGWQLDSGEAKQLLAHPVVPAVLAQLLAAWAMLLHGEHSSWMAAALQQQQAVLGEGSSSQQAEQQRRQGSKQRFRADLLSIPALHLDVRPGGKAYLEAAAARDWGEVGEKWQFYSLQALDIVRAQLVLLSARGWILAGVDEQQSHAWTKQISSYPLDLTSEVQLLAAGLVQRQRQQQQQMQRQQPLPLPQLPVAVVTDVTSSAHLLMSSNMLLHAQIAGTMQLGYAGFAPEPLQQFGLHLLQALAAPVQQLLLCPGDACGTHLLSQADVLQQQLYALRAALCGLAVVQHDDPDILVTGEPCCGHQHSWLYRTHEQVQAPVLCY